MWRINILADSLMQKRSFQSQVFLLFLLSAALLRQRKVQFCLRLVEGSCVVKQEEFKPFACLCCFSGQHGGHGQTEGEEKKKLNKLNYFSLNVILCAEENMEVKNCNCSDSLYQPCRCEILLKNKSTCYQISSQFTVRLSPGFTLLFALVTNS